MPWGSVHRDGWWPNIRLWVFGIVGRVASVTRTGCKTHSPGPGSWLLSWTLLCCVKCWLGLVESVELAGDVADQTAFDLAVGLALGPSPLGVGAGRWIGS